MTKKNVYTPFLHIELMNDIQFLANQLVNLGECIDVAVTKLEMERFCDRYNEKVEEYDEMHYELENILDYEDYD